MSTPVAIVSLALFSRFAHYKFRSPSRNHTSAIIIRIYTSSLYALRFTVTVCLDFLYSVMEDLKLKKRARDDSEEPELDTDSPEVKRLRENLLAGLDDDADAEFCTPSQDLVSFMKSFEEEITASPSAAGGEADQIVDRTSESRPDLGYLLEASDDELGLPPTTSYSSGLENELRNDLVRVESESSEFGVEFWDIPSYDPFRLGLGEAEDDYSGGNGEYVVLDGLFDHSDVDFGSSEFVWRPETMPAQ